jgi:hypothetical protein
MSTRNDPLARARRALDQVDEELDLSRIHAVTSGFGRTPAEPLVPDEDAAVRVEILRPGQRPARPRRRATAWGLAATVVLLCGAGVGTAVLWSQSGETAPGSPSRVSPAPERTRSTQEPAPQPTTDPRECSPGRTTPSATPQPATEAPPSDDCDVAAPSHVPERPAPAEVRAGS